VITDGTPLNASYGERLDDSRFDEGSFDLRTPHVFSYPGGIGMVFPIRRDSVTAGYARVLLSDVNFESSMDRLGGMLDEMWASNRLALMQIGGFLMAGMMLLGVLMAWWLSKRLSRPLTEMSAAAERIAGGNFAIRLPASGTDEIGILATALNKMAGEVNKTNRLLAKAQEISGVGSWEYDAGSERFIWSDQVYRIFEVDRACFWPTRRTLRTFIHHDDVERVSEFFSRNYEGEQGISFEFRIVRMDGEERIVQALGEVDPDSIGGPLRAIGTFQDVTDRRRDEERLSYLANYDVLTGLPNRYLFQDRLSQAMRQADRMQCKVGLLFLDLDRFKTINDTLGHAFGDDLLNQVAQRLRSAVREVDTVARLGGDEFTVTLESLASEADASAVAEKIIAAMASPFRLGAHEVFVTTSIGVTLYPDDATAVSALLKNADTAMYRAKEEGRNNYQYFRLEMNNRAHERLALETSLRSALGKGQFQLYYQPQLALASNRVIGFEALLRWRQSDGTMMSPALFVPILEDTGMIVEVGAWALRVATQALASWHKAGHEQVSVSVNLSARQFQQVGFVGEVAAALAASGVAPEKLELEITEGTLVEAKHCVETVEALYKLGTRLSIDDFGTGYSSLSYLKRFPLHKLKIDQSFVRDITVDADDAAITNAIIALSHSLGLNVIAEGVETPEQLRHLRMHGCDEIQGYLLSKPMPADDVLPWLELNHAGAPGRGDRNPKLVLLGGKGR
jgi:diguanylate cyclase (GGDEF)-like protein